MSIVNGSPLEIQTKERYREESNKAAFAVAAVEKIYAHESLTFNDTVDCEEKIVTTKPRLLLGVLPSKWKFPWFGDHKDQSGNTLRVSQSMILQGKVGKVRSHEYLVVCTRPDIASAGVDMLDGFDRGLQTNVQVFVDFDYAMGRSITVMSRSITGYGLMILRYAGSLKANLQHMKALSTT
ncbi:hypothetical protein Tco_0092769 [Tanacetum coccineum]